MTDLANSLRDRRFITLILSGVGALLVGFILISPARALNVITYGGYWMMLVLVAIAAWTWWKGVGPEVAHWPRTWRSERGPMALIALCWVLLIVHDPFGFKILMDEAMLAGTAMSMHFEKIAIVPMRKCLGLMTIFESHLQWTVYLKAFKSSCRK